MKIKGLSQEDFKLLNDIVINSLKDLGFHLYLFGSRARGDHQKFSDIDLLISGENKENIFSSVSEIREEIENSLFPYKVDIVFQDDLAKSYIENIEKDMVEI